MKRLKKMLALIMVLSITAASLLTFPVSADTPPVPTTTANTLEEAEQQFYDNITAENPAFNIIYTGDYNDLMENFPKIDDMLPSDDYSKWLISGGSTAPQFQDDGTLLLKCNYTYLMTKDQLNYVNSKTNEIISDLITPNMTDGEKEYAIHRWMMEHLEYSPSHDENTNNPYSALATGDTECLGYSMLFYKLVTLAGLNAHIVSGSAPNGGGHAWNEIELNGTWYYVDETWNAFTPGANYTIFYDLSGKSFQDRGYIWTVSDFPDAPDDYDFSNDTVPPIYVTGVTDGAAYQTDVTITFKNGTGTLNGQPFASGTTVSAEGNYTFIGTDAKESQSDYRFVIDKTAPSIADTDQSGTILSNGAFTKSSVKVQVSDKNLKSESVKINGTPSAWPSNNTFTSSGYYTVTATDLAGHSSTSSFTIDKTAPTLSAKDSSTHSMSNGGYTHYSVVASASDTNLISKTATLGGKTIAWPSNNTFSTNGTYVLSATDKAGNTSKLSFTIDKTAPSVTLKDSGKHTVGNKGFTKYDVTVTVSDSYLLSKSVKLNGKSISWSKNNTFSAAGSYTVTVTDKAGNTTSVSFTIDKTAPSVSLCDTKGHRLSSGGRTKYGVRVSYSDANLSSKSVKCNGKTISWTKNSTFTAKGSYTVTVMDKAGNSRTVSFRIG